MKNIVFVIDKLTKYNLGVIDFIPRKEDHIAFKIPDTNKKIEVEVECILHEPASEATLVFVNMVEPYYESLVKDIKW